MTISELSKFCSRQLLSEVALIFSQNCFQSKYHYTIQFFIIFDWFEAISRAFIIIYFLIDKVTQMGLEMGSCESYHQVYTQLAYSKKKKTITYHHPHYQVDKFMDYVDMFIQLDIFQIFFNVIRFSLILNGPYLCFIQLIRWVLSIYVSPL